MLAFVPSVICDAWKIGWISFVIHQHDCQNLPSLLLILHSAREEEEALFCHYTTELHLSEALSWAAATGRTDSVDEPDTSETNVSRLLKGDTALRREAGPKTCIM